MLNRVNKDQNLITQTNSNTLQQNQLLWKYYFPNMENVIFLVVRRLMYFFASFLTLTSWSETENHHGERDKQGEEQPLVTFQVPKPALRFMLFHRTCMSVGSKSLPPLFLSCTGNRKGLWTLIHPIFRQKLPCKPVTSDMLRLLHVYSNSSFFPTALSGFIDIKVWIGILKKLPTKTMESKNLTWNRWLWSDLT